MPGGSLAALLDDIEFPALVLASDPQRVLDFFARSSLFAGSRPALTALEVLNHKPGRRCTIFYAIESHEGARELVGKWYRQIEMARSMHGLLGELAAGGLALPKPLAFHEGGCVLQEYVRGRELRALAAEDDITPFTAAGRWLASLHALPPPAGLKEKTPAHELAKAEAWAAYVAMAMSEWSRQAEATAAALRSAAAGIEARESVVIHRDYYPANLLWDGASLWGIDFDQMAMGDGAVDAGSFLAQLEKLAIRDRLARAGFEAKASAFLDAYGAEREEDLGARLPFFTSYTFLKVAAAEVQRQRPGWRELSESFMGRALEEAERSAR